MGENLKKVDKLMHTRKNAGGYSITNKGTDIISYSSAV
jgi:predicted transcriptional regulator